MISKKGFIRVLFFLLFSINYIVAQDRLSFEKINSDRGLSQSIVYAVNEDSYGNLWLATEEGVVRYNSKDSYIYNRYSGLPQKVNNRISTLLVDSKNNIWIGTENGICLFDRNKNSFFQISNLLDNVKITKIIEGKNHNVFFSTDNEIWEITKPDSEISIKRKISNINPESILINDDNLFYTSKKGAFNLNLNSSISSKINAFPEVYNLISVVKKIDNSIFFGTKKGELYLTDIHFSFFNKILNSTNTVIKDIEKYNGKYLIGADGVGIIVLDNKLNRINQYVHSEDDNNSLSSNGVYDLYIDSQNLLWVATFGGGINIVNPLKNNFKIIRHEVNNPKSLSNNFCSSFLDVGNNKVWIGTKNGINIWDRSSNNWIHIKSLGNNSLPDIVLAMALNGDFVWVGTYNNGLFKVNKNTLVAVPFDTNKGYPEKSAVTKIFKVFKDKNDNIWVGGIDGKLTLIKADNSIQVFNITQVRDIFQDKNGFVFCVGKNGVFKLDPNDKKAIINSISNIKDNYDFLTINCGFQNAEGSYVFGTNGAGILIFNPKTNKITNISVKDNLPSDIIQGIIEYQKNQYWVSSTKGLTRLNINNNIPEIINFNRADGLSSNEFNNKAFEKLNSNEIIAGGINGITLFNPNKIDLQKYLPKIVFEDFQIFNKSIEPGKDGFENHINETKELELKYSQNSFQIKFAGILHGFYTKVNYSWILEGFDDTWSTPSQEAQVNYTNLSYGDYVFKVKATNKDGKWGEIRELKLTIARPWWASYLAYLIYCLSFFGLLYATIYFTKLLEVKKGKEDQINMLNNITHEIKTPLSILISSLENSGKENEIQKEKLQPTINRLNSLIKQMLNFHLVTSENNISENVDEIIVSDYFNVLISDFGPLLEEKKLKVTLLNDLQNDILYFDKDDFDKIIFNLFSNAIKYSLKNGEIELKLENTKNGNFIFSIKDYGLGIPKDQQKHILNIYYRARNVVNSQHTGSGLGLMIVKNLIDRNKGKISFESEENKGTTFIVELPNQESVYAKEMISINPQELNIESDNENLERFAENKILIVEDNEELRKNLVKSLENNFLVYEAKDGKEGLEKTEQIYPDLILTDYIMPVMDGIEMCNHLKDNINFNHIPVFMMTVLQNSKHKQESIESGITEYIEKPINIGMLLAKINNIFNWQQILKQRFLHQEDVDNAEKFKSKKDSDFIQKLENIILEKIKDENLSLQYVCDKMVMSRTSLYMKLKGLIDISPQDFIILTKLKYAKKNLIQGDISIKEVAYASGFSNPKYFSTSFKKAFGLTPTEFIKSLEKDI